MPVDYEAGAKGGSAATNYQIMPGDRVFIAEDNITAFNTYLAKVVMPVERLFGIAGLALDGPRRCRPWPKLQPAAESITATASSSEGCGGARPLPG